MIERKEVEALLAEARECGGSIGHVDSTHLAALCRAWLTMDSGIPVTLSRNDVDAMALPDSWSGQLVRIVKE